MEKIICENIFVSIDETEKRKSFNKIWQFVVNMMINKID